MARTYDEDVVMFLDRITGVLREAAAAGVLDATVEPLRDILADHKAVESIRREGRAQKLLPPEWQQWCKPASPPPPVPTRQEAREIAAKIEHPIKIDRFDLAVASEACRDALEAIQFSKMDRARVHVAEIVALLNGWRMQLD